MDPRLTMISIEKTQEVMVGQLERLNVFTPKAMNNISEDLSVSELMASALTAQLQGGVDALSALSDAEATIRSSMPRDHLPRNVTPDNQTIDAEFKVIK